MFKKATIALIAVLSCCSLVCVGFSSWSITTQDSLSETTSGTLTSEDVIVSNDYVKINTEQIIELNKKTFVVSPYGFVITNDDDTISIATKGILQIPLVINMENCYAFSKTELHVDITISLEKQSDLLTATQYLKPVCEDASVQNVQGKALSSTKEYLISFSLKTEEPVEQKEKELIVNLEFNFPVLAQYSYYLYNTQFVQESEIVNAFVFSVAVSNGE